MALSHQVLGQLVTQKQVTNTNTYVGLLAQILKEVLGSGCLRSARFTHEKNWVFDFNHLLQYPGGASRIYCVN